jgi:hypothetical protein
MNLSRRNFLLGAVALPIAAKTEVLEGIVSVPAAPLYTWAPASSPTVVFFKGRMFWSDGFTVFWSDAGDIESWGAKEGLAG